MLAFAIIIAALLTDRLLGEPRRGHPLVLFGTAGTTLHAALERRGLGRSRAAGVAAVALLVGAPALLALLLAWLLPFWLWLAVEVVGLYLAIALRSLEEHALAVARPLAEDRLEQARAALAMIVSRDTAALDAEQVAAAATESVLENGADAVFASLFWFLLAGLPGVVMHRLSNTLDAMWGYRDKRFLRFGWAAARLDDVLNYLPARLTAASYALCGNAASALACWRSQAAVWESPNAGPVMAAGAGALGVRLGGPAPYHGAMRHRPTLGEGEAASAASIHAAIALVRRAVLLWLGLILLGGLVWNLITAGG
ncbi:MAG: cobalamin biosynthesis protein [Ectothiorhodospiraceae bacterium]|nr:cobalamin biosynthesis protein [Ectothiorhodospiraceae bacterium]MCH8506119.1 adenosylcobinamide-phosphate synthase CbiB [Ectothiorhodospiraceae bacterium]